MKHMLVGGVVLLGLLMTAGVSFERALPWAVLLACPLMMIGMMALMGRNGSAGNSRFKDAPEPIGAARPEDASARTEV